MRNLLLLPLLFLLFGCSSPEKPVSRDEALKLSHSIDSFVRKKNGMAIDKLFSGALLGKKLKSKNVLADAVRDRGISEGLKKAAVGSQIINTLKTIDDS